MRGFISKKVRVKLQAGGMKKLPFSVISAVVESVKADIAVALEKSVAKWTAPRRIARTFTECVSGKRARDSKGNGVPFGQLPCASPERDETTRLIGTHAFPLQ
jgi:hypothetical protein